VEALRKAGCEILGLLAIFSYGFEIAKQNFLNSNCQLTTLCNYNAMIDTALETEFISENQIETLKEWRNNPSEWQ